MILIITHKQDYTADFVVNKLNQRQIKYKRLNCEDVLDEDFSLSFDNSLSFDFFKQKSFSSVWFRRTKLPEIYNLVKEDRAFIWGEIDAFFSNLYSCIDTKWLSNPFNVYKAENKLFQLKIATDLGFKIPKTLVTSSKKRLLEFYFENNKNIIVKPLSSTRIQYENDTAAFIFTSVLRAEIIQNIEGYDLTPCIFQNKIEKEYELRVTVVNEKVFSAVVYSQESSETSVDWRKGRLKFYVYELPSEIEQLCVLLIKEMGLNFGAIDLIKTKTNEYVFLEVNPNGQWAWIENQTGLCISDAIIKELL